MFVSPPSAIHGYDAPGTKPVCGDTPGATQPNPARPPLYAAPGSHSAVPTEVERWLPRRRPRVTAQSHSRRVGRGGASAAVVEHQPAGLFAAPL